MADTIVYDLLKQLGSLTAQQSIQEINLIVDVDEEVKKLKDNLESSRICWTMPRKGK